MFNLLKQLIFKIKIKRKICKEGLEDIKLNLILQNINEYANKKRYEQNVKQEGLNLLIVEHLFLKFFILFIYYISFKFN